MEEPAPRDPLASSEEDLMAAYVRGDRAAFAALFARVAPRVHAFFVRCFGNTAVADDLLQATFLKVHHARARYRTGSKLRPWLFTIAWRVRLDELRRRKRAPFEVGQAALDRAERAGARPFAEGPLERTDAGRLPDVVNAALQRLPEGQRVIIQLHRYEEMTFPEIGKALGLSEGAVRVRAFRGYQSLRRQLSSLLQKETEA